MNALDFNKMNLKELNSSELEDVEGGVLLSIIVGLAIGLGVAYLTRSR